MDKNEARLASARHFVFLLIPNFSMIAFVNALEVLRMANQVQGREIYHWSVASTDGTPVTASNGIAIDTMRADTVHVQPADVVFVCGGNDVQRVIAPEDLELVRRFARVGTLIGGVCTGAYVLAKAGLLTGYECAIHWEYLFAQMELFAKVDFQKCIFKVDRDRITCTGGIAPLEMMLYIVRLSLGAEAVDMISDQFAVDSIRKSNARQQVAQFGSSRKLLAEVVELMENNVEVPLSLVEISERSGVGERTLLRVFSASMGSTVMQHYRSLRLRRARQLLLQSNLSLTDIGIACGFQAASHFTTSYRREFGITPSQERTGLKRHAASTEKRETFACAFGPSGSVGVQVDLII